MATQKGDHQSATRRGGYLPVARRRRAGGASGRGDAFAAIDLGTNNCRLLIARPEGGSFRVIDAFSRIVRLGEGVGARGVLSEDAMDRTIAALRICAGKIRQRRVGRARSVATAACRRATNCDAFIDRVARETGIDLEIISTREEAQLAIAGCLPLLDATARRALMFDIGGGSTELVWLRCDGAAREIIGWTSLPCGVVTLAEDHGGDRIARDTYDAMVDRVHDMLAAFEKSHRIAGEIGRGGVQMLGTSGTVTTVAGVHLELPRYDRSRVDGLRLCFTEVDAVSARLLELDQAGRAAIPTIGPERADLVVAGCAILDAIQQCWPVGSLRVADRGIREGLLMDMIHPCRPAAALAS
jgi:exopolyphosphatase/guanosine-5'-triphosphate,3'-diphosphate pyrophosphatase